VNDISTQDEAIISSSGPKRGPRELQKASWLNADGKHEILDGIDDGTKFD
jgi:hypothetical protein